MALPDDYDFQNVRYSEREFQCVCDIWLGGSGTPLRAAVIRFEGGGMNRTSRRLIETQYDFFTDQGTGVGGWYEDDDNIAVFSCDYTLHRANVEYPRGADTEAYYPGGSLGGPWRYASNPGYMDRWLLCVFDAIAFVKRNAATYGVDPDKVILTGSSAGGLMVAAAGYMSSLGYSASNDIFHTRPNPRETNTDVAALILHNTPMSLELNYNNGIFSPFVGISSNPWDSALRARAKRVSAMDILEDSGKFPHVFSWHGGAPSDGLFDPTGDVITPEAEQGTAHSPSWGVMHHNRIQSKFGGPLTGLATATSPAHAFYTRAESSTGELEDATPAGNTWAHLFGGSGEWPIDELNAWLAANDLL